MSVLMEGNTKDFGRVENDMVGGFFIIRVERYFWENSLRELSKVQDTSRPPTEIHSPEHGKEGDSTDKES